MPQQLRVLCLGFFSLRISVSNLTKTWKIQARCSPFSRFTNFWKGERRKQADWFKQMMNINSYIFYCCWLFILCLLLWSNAFQRNTDGIRSCQITPLISIKWQFKRCSHWGRAHAGIISTCSTMPLLLPSFIHQQHPPAVSLPLMYTQKLFTLPSCSPVFFGSNVVIISYLNLEHLQFVPGFLHSCIFICTHICATSAPSFCWSIF